MTRFRPTGRECNGATHKKRNERRWLRIDTPCYLYSIESTPNSELDQVIVRFLRLEASSPALRDTETYLPVRNSVRMEVADRSVSLFASERPSLQGPIAKGDIIVETDGKNCKLSS